MRTKCRSIATFHRPIPSHWSLPLNKNSSYYRKISSSSCIALFRALKFYPVLWIWIRIRTHFGWRDSDPGRQKSAIKAKKFHVLKCWAFSFEGWRLLLLLGRPFWRPWAKYRTLNVLTKKVFKKIFQLSIFFLQFLFIKAVDPDPQWNQCGSTTLASTNRSKANCSLLNGVLKIRFSAQLGKLIYWKQHSKLNRLNNVSSWLWESALWIWNDLVRIRILLFSGRSGSGS